MATSHSYVIISNPCNPSGTFIPPADLAHAAGDYPDSTLIVDESYCDFVADPVGSSLLGTELTNIGVLRSPSKAFGIGGARCGALWTRNSALSNLLTRQIPAWPLSILDTAVVVAALRAPGPLYLSTETWTQATCGRLRDTAARMERLLAEIDGVQVLPSPTHYRFVLTPEPYQLYDHLLEHGIVARVFDADQPGRIGGLRIASPREAELRRLEEALTDVRDSARHS